MKKRILTVVVTMVLTSCGYTARNSEFTGQVKFVESVTPLFCGDYLAAGVSLGVMRNGTGTMSTHDEKVLITNPADKKKFLEAAESGKLAKFTYDERRFTLCVPRVWVTAIEVLP